MTEVTGFAPVARADAWRLVLGSMPGTASLAAGQYYAHPRNAFWPIMATLTGEAATQPYATRLAGLGGAGIALWDVLQACRRPGSLDADIAPGSMVANDFAGFLAAHPGIVLIAFNGATAARSFGRHVLPRLPADLRDRLTLRQLPSTSPAHAGMPFAAKLAAWQDGLSRPAPPCRQSAG